jgi:hypothetical protein
MDAQTDHLLATQSAPSAYDTDPAIGDVPLQLLQPPSVAGDGAAAMQLQAQTARSDPN